MNNLFDNTEKTIKYNRSLSQQLQIKHVLNPYTQSYIDVELANTLGILYNGYYRNRYGGLIPLHIAASKGFIEFTINNQIDNEEMEIEYRSKDYSYITNLLIRQVYDNINHCMISYRQAIDKGYLDTELFLYSCSDINLSIHEAFYRGLILGELRTNINSEEKFSKKIIKIQEKNHFEYDSLFSTLTNIINSLCEFKNSIFITKQCQLTSDGFIQDKLTGKSYILTQAIQLGLVSFQENFQINDSTIMDEQMDISPYEEEDSIKSQLFSDTLIFDLLKTTTNPKDETHLTNINKFLSVINTC